MATTEELVIKITAEIGDLKKQMEDVKKSVQDVGNETETTGNKTQSSLSKLIPSWKEIAVAATAAVAAIGAAGLSVINVAADADATAQKFNTVFKQYAGETQQWADGFSSSMGRSRTDVMAWSASMQDTLVPMGYSREAAAQLSEQLVTMGVDLGAFYDQADSDVMEKITSGLVGNTENWREWGVVASESAIKQQLINMLGEEGAKNATEQQKVQARLNILIAGTADAQGQAAREADSYQSQLKKVTGQVKDMMAEAGKDAMERLAGVLKRVTDMLADGGSDQLVTVFKALSEAVAWAAEQVLYIIGVFEDWGKAGAFDTIKDFVNDTMARFRTVVGDAFSTIQYYIDSGMFDRLGQVFEIVARNYTAFVDALEDIGFFQALGAVIGSVVFGIMGFIDLIARVIIAIDDFRRSIMSTVADVLDALSVVVPGAKEMADGIRKELEKVPTDVSSALDPALPDAVSGAVDKAGTDGEQASRESVTKIADHWSVLAPKVKDKIDPSLSTSIVGEVTDAGNAGATAVNTSVQDIVDEYEKMPGDVGNAVSGLSEVMRSHSKVAGDAGVKIAEENVIHVGQAYSTLPYQASKNLEPLAPAVEHQVHIVDAPATAAAKTAVGNMVAAMGVLPKATSESLGGLSAAVTNPVKTADTQASAASGTLVSNVTAKYAPLAGNVGKNVDPINASINNPITAAGLAANAASLAMANSVAAKYVPLPGNVGKNVAPIGQAINAPIASASITAQTTSSMMVMGINARITPLVPQTNTVFTNMKNTMVNVLNSAVSAITGLGGSMYNAGANLVQRAIDGLNSKLSSLRSVAASVMSFASGGSGSSSSGGSSYTTSGGTSTGAPLRTASSEELKKAAASGTLIAGSRPSNVNVNINNKAADVVTAQKTTYTAVKSAVYGNARVV